MATGKKRDTDRQGRRDTDHSGSRDQWILHALNQLRDRISTIEDEVKALRKDIGGLKRIVWIGVGILIAVSFISSYISIPFEITISPVATN